MLICHYREVPILFVTDQQYSHLKKIKILHSQGSNFILERQIIN